MELEVKSKIETHIFTMKSASAIQADYEAKIVIEKGVLTSCDVSTTKPMNREQWDFYGLVSKKINQLCKEETPTEKAVVLEEIKPEVIAVEP